MAVYVRSVERGILSVSLGDAKLVQGPKGDTGNGIASAVLNGDYTLTLNFTDGSSYTTPSIRGAQGLQGEKGSKGEKGEPGTNGTAGMDGKDGAAATVTVGTVATGAPGTEVSITNSGTENAAVLNFTIPRGETGPAGPGSGDMVTATYDPEGKAQNIFAYADNKASAVQGNLDTHTGNTAVHFTAAEREKLAGIEAGANSYTHPANHPASMITEDSTHRFTSDTEKAAWNAKQTALTFDSTPAEDSTNPVTSGGVYAALNAHNQAASTITAGTFAGQVVANASGQAVGTSLLRNSKLVSTETTPTVNGEICWTYQ